MKGADVGARTHPIEPVEQRDEAGRHRSELTRIEFPVLDVAPAGSRQGGCRLGAAQLVAGQLDALPAKLRGPLQSEDREAATSAVATCWRRRSAGTAMANLP